MHLAEGTLPLEQALGWSAVGAFALAWSIRGEQQIRGEQKSREDLSLPSTVMAGATSLLFAATLLPLPIPVVGATSHICLTPILALIVGVRRIVWPTFFVLLLQAVFFAHGGLTTLGINTLALGLFGPLLTVGLWMLLRRFDLNNAWGLAIACGAGDLFVYLVDAMVLSLALVELAEPMTTFTSVLLGFAPVQFPLAVLEAVASVGIVRLLTASRPDLLPDSLLSLKKARGLLGTVATTLLFVGLTGCGYEGIDGTVFGAITLDACLLDSTLASAASEAWLDLYNPFPELEIEGGEAA